MKKLLPIMLVALLITACGKESNSEVQTGATGPQGPAGPAGLSVTSNQIINAVGTNLCTQYTGELCLFRGGQRVKYSDGTVFLTSAFGFLYGVSGDTDSDQTSLSLIIPPTSNSSWSVVSELVARGDGYKRLFLVYQRDPESFTLVHDTNGSFTPDSGDTTILTLTLSNW